MINQLEVPMYLQDALPEIRENIKPDDKTNAYKLMNTLTTFTSKNIQAHNYNVVKRCFKVADKLYSKGNCVVQNAVQNVFVYSFTNIFQTYSNERQDVLAIIPITLYTLYMAQVHHEGC